MVAENLRKSIEALNIPHAHSTAADHVTISMGIASIIPREGASSSTLVESADEGLYEAKKTGRNRFVSAHELSKKVVKVAAKKAPAKTETKKQPAKKKKKAARAAG